MKAIVLVRVSTERQHLDEQREEVVAMAKHDGYDDSNIILIENKESAIKIKDENVFKTIEITSKKYGKLNYFYQYIFNKHRRYTLFKVKYSSKGNKLMKSLNYK